jgi:hypothetical protein
LLATNHAVFEAAGIMSHDAVGVLHHADERSDPGQQRWHKVEKTLIKQQTGFVAKLASSQSMLPIFEIPGKRELHAMQSAVAELPTRERADCDIRNWQFLQRAAPLPGAPFGLV